MISLMKDDIKKLRHVIILYCGFLGFGYLLSAFSYESKNVLSYSILFVIVVIAITIIPLINFQYLHNRTSATHILSLPYTKGQIFLVRYSSGLMVVLLPSIVYVLALSLTHEVTFTTSLLTIVLAILIYYTLGCLVANLTGTILMHIFMFIVITVLPLVLYVSLNSIFSQYVKGLSGTSLLESVIALLLPISQLLLSAIEGELSMYYVPIYSLYFAILCSLAFASSIKRPFERTGNPIAFAKVDVIIKIAVIICFSWILTAVLSFGEHLVLMAIIAIVVVCMVVELLMHKTLHYKQVCVEISGILILTIGIYFMSVNYLENYVPSNVQSANIIFDCYGNALESNTKITKENAIAVIKEIHQYLIDTPEYSSNDEEGIKISYTLANGDIVTRVYNTDVKMVNSILDTIVSSKANKDVIEEYYSYLDTIIDQKCEQIAYYSPALAADIVLEGQQITRFKNILQNQKERFIHNPKLFRDIVFQRDFYENEDYRSDMYVSSSKNNKHMNGRYYSVYRNDPIYFAMQEFVKK